MAEHTSTVHGTVVSTPDLTLKAETAPRPQSDAKPRREPYRPSSAVLLEPPLTPLTTGTASMHVDLSHLTSAYVSVGGGDGVVHNTPLRRLTTPTNNTAPLFLSHEALDMPSPTLAYGEGGADVFRRVSAAFTLPSPASFSSPTAATTPTAARAVSTASSPSRLRGVDLHSCDSPFSAISNRVRQSDTVLDIVPTDTNSTLRTNNSSVDATRGTAAQEATATVTSGGVSASPPPNPENSSGAAAQVQAVQPAASSVRPLLADLLIQQVRNTPFNQPASRPVGSMQRRRSVNPLGASVPSTTISPTSNDARLRRHAGTKSSPGGETILGEETASTSRTTTPTTAGVSTPVAHRGVTRQPPHSLNLKAASEAPRAAAPPTNVLLLEGVFSPSPSAASTTMSGGVATRVSVAHILQREAIRRLLSRVLFRWLRFCRLKSLRPRSASCGHHSEGNSKANSDSHDTAALVGSVSRSSLSALTFEPNKNKTSSTSREHQGGGGGPTTSPATSGCKGAIPPPWKPIVEGGAHSGSSLGGEDNDDYDEGMPHYYNAASVVVGGEDDVSDDPEDDVHHEDHAHIHINAQRGQNSTAPRVAQQQQERQIEGGLMGAGKSSTLSMRRAASRGVTPLTQMADPIHASPPPQQKQASTDPSADSSCASGPQRETSSSIGASFSVKSTSLLSSEQQKSAPLCVSDLHTTLICVAARPNIVTTTTATSPRGTNSNNILSSMESPLMCCSRTHTSSNSAFTPHYHGSSSGVEGRKKSIITQYLAGRPLGNVSPQQSSTNLLPSVGSAAVEMHALALSGASSAPYSRSMSRRRSEGLWAVSTATSNTGGRIFAQAGVMSDSEEQSSSSLYFTPRSRQSSGLGGRGASFDDVMCLSNSSTSAAAAAATTTNNPAPSTSPVVQSLPQLLIREAESRSFLQSSESRRRSRMQRAVTARIDQLLMMALHHNSSERGLHPSLRASASPSSMVSSPSHSSDKGSDDDGSSRGLEELEIDFADKSCSVSVYNNNSSITQAQDSPEGGGGGKGSSRSTRCSPAVPLIALRPFLIQCHEQLPTSPERKSCPRVSIATTSSPVSRQLSHTKRGAEGDKVLAEVAAVGDGAEKLRGVSHDGEEMLLIEGDCQVPSRAYHHHHHLHTQQQQQQYHYDPVKNGGSPCTGSRGAVEVGNAFGDEYDEDDVDTATARSEGTVRGLAATCQWVPQQQQQTHQTSTTPPSAAAGAEMLSESVSSNVSHTSISPVQLPAQTRETSAARRKCGM